MSRRRRIMIAVALFAPTVLVFGACSFPEVTFGGSSGEAGTQEKEGGPGVDGSSDAVAIDAIVRDDATAMVDAAVCSTRARCDCDNDGYLEIGCDASPGDAGDGGDSGISPNARPGDCDDLDPLRHPEAGFTETPPPATHGGDWDCNNDVEKFPPQVSCKGTGLTGCSGSVSGFVSDPACGAKSDTFKCVSTGLPVTGCTAQLDVPGATRACR